MSRSPWTLLHAHFHQILKDRNLLPLGQRILIAVSGGQDSLCLAKLLLDLQSRWFWELAIAHCDHRWRSDSAANADFVHTLAQSWQLPYYQQTATVELTSEAAARTWRYESLAAIANQQNFNCIVTGHTASDRAETMLYNLIRGSGMDGLQALTWQRPLTDNIQLIRPLLSVSRTQTAQFCQEMEIPIWKDSTNDERQYARNRIRLDLLPYIQENLNPGVEKALSQTAEVMQSDVEYLEAEANALREQVAGLNTTDGFNRQLLRKAPLALQRRVIRQILQQALPVAPSFEHIEKLVNLITAPNRSQTDPFPGGLIACVEGDWIWLRNR
ncbi:MAG: tRNA lysidine(34) synthetase TilS [Leptodesmis sp.]|uniref:tRNA lysidine(34) synthetase TilS n=1 Tax=Leptodesmis sp. TaxID=3100501 RepID=UPI003D107D5E